ncbi:PREDICTED: apidaecins type 22-like isoform X2 [Polistes dominula]|uniref:Apidaecins type 22-like isoform X2 n=1 Tax=Polistes dominula TaxID=743375 RepID=A0ABM1IKH0_POLDO|nr:PREDICTED: apidaecins type 22-like isoform X2 [Polistes dominula]
MRSLAIRAALAAMLVIVVTGEPFESHVNPYAIAKETDGHLLNLQNPEFLGYQENKSERLRREADPEPSRPRPQQVPPRPPHPRLRREADPEPSRPRPQQVPPRPPHPRLR